MGGRRCSLGSFLLNRLGSRFLCVGAARDDMKDSESERHRCRSASLVTNAASRSTPMGGGGGQRRLTWLGVPVVEDVQRPGQCESDGYISGQIFSGATAGVRAPAERERLWGGVVPNL